MKRIYFSICLVFTLIITSVIPSFASAPRNGYWSTQCLPSIQVSYNELSNMLTYCNQAIDQGTWSWDGVSSTFRPVARIVPFTSNGRTVYVINVSYQSGVAKAVYNFYYSALSRDQGGTVSYPTYYALADSDNDITLGPIHDLIETISGHTNSIKSFCNNISNKLSYSFNGRTYSSAELSYLIKSDIDSYSESILSKLSYTYQNRTYSAAELLYLIKSDNSSYITSLLNSISSVETAISSVNGTTGNVNSSLSAVSNKLSYTINSRSYSTAELLYLIRSDLDSYHITLFNDLDSLITSSSNLSYLTNLSSISTSSSTASSSLSDIYTYLQDNSNYPFCIVSASSLDANGDEWPRSYIPYESASDIIAYLNNHYQNRKIKLLSNSNAQSNRWFVRADMSDNGYIRVYCTSTQTSSIIIQYYLCDTHHYLVVGKTPTYLSKLNSIESAISGIVFDTTTLESYLADISSDSSSIDSSLSDILSILEDHDYGLAASSGYLLGISNYLYAIFDPKFDDLVDAVEAIPESTYKSGNLYLSGYLTDSHGVAYSTIQSPYSSTTDIIGYINSEMVGQPITLLPRDDMREGDLIRYVDHAYLDSNNYIRVDAANALGTVFSYFLCSPEMAIFTSLLEPSQPDFDDIIPYIDDIETKLDSINSSIGDLSDHVDAILNYIDNQDFVSDVRLVSWLTNYHSYLNTVLRTPIEKYFVKVFGSSLLFENLPNDTSVLNYLESPWGGY